MSESIIQVRHLTKRIKGKPIVQDLNFDIHKGEVLGFLGPNGAGKTTTMRMMLGLISILEGDVTIAGHSIKSEKEKALQHVGGIVENPEMYKFLTAYDNLQVFRRMYRDIPEKRIEEVIKLVGLQKAIKQKVKTFSLGMRQRLGIAQAMLQGPDVLILDEPTNGLDPAGIRELRDYLRSLAKEEGIAVFISSHLLAEIEQICDRVLIIQNGKITNEQQVMEKETEKLVIAFDTNDGAKALSLVQSHFNQLTVTLENEKLMIEVEKEMIPAVNALFVQNEIKVYGIERVRKSLEDRFLELTGKEAAQ
ncbi:ABC transporter ATP-binding protein [Camelliibacillus cellulosilyticus]|uniref:ABC transporter ATP-binding protein n=1 Tax=Camelliibacillus cellulosilyticus TaxID=2174486 RepID=A0ABV9GPT2_9BACL